MEKKYSIPGFQGSLTSGQQILARILIEENGFRPEMRGGSAKTVKFTKGRKYGYINNDVTKYGGVMGYTFPPHYVDASPFENDKETTKWFNSKYPKSEGKFTYHFVPSKHAHYLIILDVDVALRVCGVTRKIRKDSKNVIGNDDPYQQVKSKCIECFEKMGVRANFARSGNIVECMKELATGDWPENWIEWVVENAGDVIKGVEIDQ